jgi:hypothetical protein
MHNRTNHSEGLKNKMIKNHLYNPGDILLEYWRYKGKEINVARYMVIKKREVEHCSMKDVGYTSYDCYVMYTYDQWEREDRNGLRDVGELYEITHWNDMDAYQLWAYTDRVEVVRSGLTWEDMD